MAEKGDIITILIVTYNSRHCPINVQNPAPDRTQDATKRKRAISGNEALMLLPADVEPSVAGTVFDPFPALTQHFNT